MGKKIKLIQLAGGWPTNIGNAFIDLGAQQLIKEVDPDIEFVFINDICKKHILLDVDFDVLSISGTYLDRHMATRTNFFQELKKHNPHIKIIFNGIGGWTYKKAEIDIVKEFMDTIKPDLLISRDMVTHENYKNNIESYSGIDCGFFISDYFNPIKINRKYSLLIEVPKKYIKKSQYPYITVSNVPFKTAEFQSVLPEDYLHLYANAKEIYSNRIHGCITSCAFGVPTCLIYRKYPRDSIFEKVGCESIFRGLSNPNMQRIKQEKENHVNILKNYFKKLIK